MGKNLQYKERWDLLNLPGQWGCYPRALKAAKGAARLRRIPIMLRHHGPRHLEDQTRANQYVLPDGSVDIRRNESGGLIDAA